MICIRASCKGAESSAKGHTIDPFAWHMNTGDAVALISHCEKEDALKKHDEEYYITFLEHCLSLQITYPVHHEAFEEVAFFFCSKEEHAQIDLMHTEAVECARKTAEAKAEVAAQKLSLRQQKKDTVVAASKAKKAEALQLCEEKAAAKAETKVADAEQK